jgi:ubiquinone/menaquinone biosynthesis C-methylase UbiE
MGLILDARSVKLYESWCRSPQGKALDQVVEAAIPALLDPHPGERILDIGCGDGNHLMLFNRLGLDTSGIDASPYMISRARERLGNRSSLKTGRAEDLPFDDNEFDLAVLINSLEFLDDPLEALREAGRVARRKVFVGVMNSLSWYCLRSKLKGLLHESLFRYVRFYDLWELKSYARMAFGEVPMTWSCARPKASLVERVGGPLTDFWDIKHCPFGLFLGISITLQYRVRTEQHPLKIGLGEARQSVMKGVTMGRFNRLDGVQGNERSLSL